MPSNCGPEEDSWKSLGQQGDQTSQSYGRSILNIHWKDGCWIWCSSILVTWCEQMTHWESPDAGKDRGQKEKRVSEDETAGWHHQCNEHELGQTLGNREGQGGLACCSPSSCKELDTTEQLNNNNNQRFCCGMMVCLRTNILLTVQSCHLVISNSLWPHGL